MLSISSDGEHCTGLLAPLGAGSAVIIPEGGKFSASTFWQDAVKHGATFYTAVPTMHQVCRKPLHLNPNVFLDSRFFSCEPDLQPGSLRRFQTTGTP